MHTRPSLERFTKDIKQRAEDRKAVRELEETGWERVKTAPDPHKQLKDDIASKALEAKNISLSNKTTDNIIKHKLAKELENSKNQRTERPQEPTSREWE